MKKHAVAVGGGRRAGAGVRQRERWPVLSEPNEPVRGVAVVARRRKGASAAAWERVCISQPCFLHEPVETEASPS